ncbi:MAG: hypothetical protein M3135_08255, partial [Actinomycetota bacterium]|nr:hypothetical protein [Actinomycetota bacterium]
MQHPHHEGPPPLEPSRRRPPRAPAADPLPIPEAGGPPRGRPAGVQDVLAAHQRTVDARIEEGLREIRLAVAEAVGRAIGEPAEPAGEEPPVRAPVDDIIRGLIAHTEERFQALSLRLRRIEDVLRSVAKREGPDMEQHLEALRRSITAVAATHQQEFARVLELNRQNAAKLAQQQRTATERLAKFQRAVAEILSKQQRTAIEELGERMGRGISAVAEQLKADLQARQDAMLEHYLRGLASELRRHRGQKAPSPAPEAAAAASPPPQPSPLAKPSPPSLSEGVEPAPRPVRHPEEEQQIPAELPKDQEMPAELPKSRQEPRHYLIERKQQAPPAASTPPDGVF